jgi:hypothetical protein
MPSIDIVVAQGVASLASQKDPIVDLQSDETVYGRGDFHLSASLEDDDVIVYQNGTWTVDASREGANRLDAQLRVALKPMFNGDSPLPKFQVL